MEEYISIPPLLSWHPSKRARKPIIRISRLLRLVNSNTNASLNYIRQVLQIYEGFTVLSCVQEVAPGLNHSRVWNSIATLVHLCNICKHVHKKYPKVSETIAIVP